MTEAVKVSPATLSAIDVFRDLPLADYEALSHIVKTHTYQLMSILLPWETKPETCFSSSAERYVSPPLQPVVKK